jgi:hypothetical protein
MDEQDDDYFCLGGLIVPLKKLHFGDPTIEDSKITYQAFVEQFDAPCSPVFSLTVSTVLPPNVAEAAREFRRMREEMRAAFLLTAPPDDSELVDPENAASDDDDPSDVGWVIEIDPALERTTMEGERGVVFVVQASIPGYREPPATTGGKVALDYSDSLGAGLSNVFTATKSGSKKATVNSTQGWERLYPGGKRVNQGYSNRRHTWGHKVTVANYSGQLCKYTLVGAFKNPPETVSNG